MSNLVTLTQDEINRFNLKGKEVGDVLTAEEYSTHQKEYEASQNKKPSTEDKKTSTEDASDKKASKK